MKKKTRMKVTEVRFLAEGICSMKLQYPEGEAPDQVIPGQFAGLYPNDASKLLPRPISICRWDPERKELCFVFRTAGAGTASLAAQKAGDTVDLLGLLGNLIGAVLSALLIAAALPQLRETAIAACEKRLMQLPVQTLLRGFFCGILMYSAIWIYREKKTAAGILFCIPVFILAGFEHSVADMFYFALAGLFTWKAIVFILLAVLGNSLGGMFIPAVQSLKGEKKP